MQTLEEKGVPQPRLVVPAAVILVLAALLLFAVPTILSPSDATVQFTLSGADGKPVPNARVTLVAGQKEFTATSDAAGLVIFEKVPPNQKLQLRISAPGHPDETPRITYETTSVRLNALPAPTEITFSAQVFTDERVPIESAIVRFSPDAGSSQTDVTDAFGEAKVRLSDTSRVVVEVTREGYKTERKSVILADQKTVEILLQKSADVTPTLQPPAAQSVLIRVSDQSGSAVRGVSVRLIDSDTQTPFRMATTDASGDARLDRVDPNKAFTVSIEDPQDRYYAFASDFPTTASSDPILITLNAAPVNDQLVILVKDKSGNPVTDATITAYDASKKTYLVAVATDSSGRAALTVDASPVRVTLYAPGFLPKSLTAKNKEQRTEVLESAEGKTVSIKVLVQKHLDPAPDAEVQLYSADGFVLGVPAQFTGADGSAIFDAPKSSNALYAQATLGSSIGSSDRAVPQSDIEWTITLLPPKIPYKVTVRDAVSDKPVNDATVRFVTTTEKTTCKTKEGACQVNVPAESEFRIVVEHPAYLAYQSASQLVSSDQKTPGHSVRLYPKALTQNAVVQFQGFYTSDGQLLREAQNAQVVSSRFLVSLPTASASDTSRFAVWIAPTPAPLAVITRVDGPAVFYTGTDPATACNPPLSDNNSEFGQWVVFEFPKGFSGTQQVTVDYFVLGDAKPPAALSIQYNLHGLRKDVPFVFPADSEKLQQLLQQPSITESDFCGQKSVSQRLPIARDVLTCQEAYCSKAVFVTQDGLRLPNSAQIPAGQTFGMDIELVGLQSGIHQVQITAPSSVQMLSLQVQGSANATQTRTDLATGDVPNTATLTVTSARNEKIRLHLDARTVRAAALSEITITLEDADGIQHSFTRFLIITGTNRFTLSPSLTELEVGLSQTLRVGVKDQFGKPVTDAVLELYECEGNPLNGQTLLSTDARSGSYSFKVQPSTIGIIGIRATQPQFQTAEECVLPVRAVDFLEAEPESFTLKGDTQKETITERITLTTLLAVKSKISSTVKCTDANGSDASAPFTLSPKTLTLKDSSTVQVQANLQQFKGRCDITFLAKVNKDNAAADLVTVDIDLKGPPRPEQLCPTSQTGVRCMTATEAKDLRCTKNALLCTDAGASCYQCNLGPQTLPTSVSLSVSNYQSDASQTYAIALEEAPEECRVEGFTNNPAYAPYGYNNPYGTNPYGQQTGYAAPNSYYQYQPNPYTHHATNPYYSPGACMPYSGGYAYGPTYAPTYSSAYPAGTGYPATGYVSGGYPAVNPYAGGYPAGSGYVPGAYNPGAYPGTTGYPNNPGAYNPGIYPGTYPTTPGFNPAPGLANPNAPYANCQAIIAKLSPYCQVYFTQYSPYNTYQNYYSQSYRDPWSNNLNPQYPSPASYQYPQQRAAVTVQAECTRTEIRVTAQYTGGDTHYGGELGGNQQGFLLVRAGGQTKQIPITVNVQTPFSPGPYPGGYPGGHAPTGYPTQQIPPQCLLEYQQILIQSQTPATANATPQEGLDESGLPDAIDVYYNKYTGQGTFERELKPPAGATLSLVKPTDARVKMEYAANKLRVSVQCKKTKDVLDCPDSVPFKATWTFTNVQAVQKDRSVRISQDDFQPAVLQLLITDQKKDAAIFDVSTSGDFSKAKCKDTANAKCRPSEGTISAESTSTIKDSKLEISNLGDYQIRQIPVRASIIGSSLVVKAGDAEKTVTYNGPLMAQPDCQKVNEATGNFQDALETLTCTKETLKVKAKESTPPVQGWVEFTFEDSARNYDRVSHKPKVQIIVEGKAVTPTTEILITLPSGTITPDQTFTVGFKFPANDDASARKINFTLTPDAGQVPSCPEEVVFVASQITASPQGDGTLSHAFCRTGIVKITIETLRAGQRLTKIESFRIVKATAVATTTTTAPGGTTTVPGGTTTTPGATPSTTATAPGALTLTSLTVEKSGTPPGQESIKLSVPYTGDLSKAVAYNVLILKGSAKKIYTGTTVSTSSSGGTFVLLLTSEYAEIKKFLEDNGEAHFALALYADVAKSQSLGRVEKLVKASDLGFTARSGGASAPGGTSGGSTPPAVSQANPPTESIFYDLGNQHYTVLLIKNDWHDTPRAGPVHIGGMKKPDGSWSGGTDYYLKLYHIMDPGWFGSTLRVATPTAIGVGYAIFGTGATLLSVTPVGWVAIGAGLIVSYAVGTGSYASIRLEDAAGKGWNCGYLLQWGNEAHLKAGESIVCSTWNPLGTSANIRIKVKQYYPTTTTYSTISGYQSGWAEVEVSPP